MTLDEATQKLRSFYKAQGRLPSYSEMCDVFSFSAKSSCFELVEKLIKAGVLEKDTKGKIKAVSLFPPLPLYSSIKAGYPAMAEEQFVDEMRIYEFAVKKPEASFVVRVSGESMINAGIFPEDVVVVQKDKNPRNGDIVAALVDGEWTLKYFYKKEGKVTLVPANPNYPTIEPQSSLSIGGVVISIIRRCV